MVGSSPTECHNHILQTINLALDMDLLPIRYRMLYGSKTISRLVRNEVQMMWCMCNVSLKKKKNLVQKHGTGWKCTRCQGFLQGQIKLVRTIGKNGGDRLR